MGGEGWFEVPDHLTVRLSSRRAGGILRAATVSSRAVPSAWHAGRRPASAPSTRCSTVPRCRRRRSRARPHPASRGGGRGSRPLPLNSSRSATSDRFGTSGSKMCRPQRRPRLGQSVGSRRHRGNDRRGASTPAHWSSGTSESARIIQGKKPNRIGGGCSPATRAARPSPTSVRIMGSPWSEPVRRTRPFAAPGRAR